MATSASTHAIAPRRKSQLQLLAKETLRGFLITTFVLSAFVLLYGCMYNYLGYKYTRALPDKSCSNHILITELTDSLQCCDKGRRDYFEWVCQASFDSINHKLASKYAFLVPLIPFVLTIISEAILSFVSSSSVKDSNKDVNIRGDVVITHWNAHIFRAILYILIFSFRTVIF